MQLYVHLLKLYAVAYLVACHAKLTTFQQLKLILSIPDISTTAPGTTNGIIFMGTVEILTDPQLLLQ